MTITRAEVAENFPLSQADATTFALRTMSSRGFYNIVHDAVSTRKSLSAVRMGDGERTFLIDAAYAAAVGNPDAIVQDKDNNVERVRRLGIEGMPVGQLASLLHRSAAECDFFGPNINGLTNKTYSLYPWVKIWNLKQPLVDNFWCNDWDLNQRTALLKKARQVLVIHANPVTGITFAKRARAYLDVGIRFIQMQNWKDTDRVVEECAKWDYPMILASVGPGAKWILPVLSKQCGGRVVLDIGNSMDQWLLYELWKAEPSKLDEKVA